MRTFKLQVRFRFGPVMNLNWTFGSGSLRFRFGFMKNENRTEGPVLGSEKSLLNRTEPDRGNTIIYMPRTAY